MLYLKELIFGILLKCTQFHQQQKLISELESNKQKAEMGKQVAALFSDKLIKASQDIIGKDAEKIKKLENKVEQLQHV